MIHKKSITLVVPCKNEAKIIGGFIRRVPKCIDEIIVVDNNSTDNTASVAKKAGARVVKEKRTVGGIGYGYAHMRGIREATGDFIVAMDGDDTYPLTAVKHIVTLMETKGIDFVSCNRLPLKNPKAISLIRQLGIHILNSLTQLLYGYPIKDILTGMWIIRKTIAKELNVTSGDWNFSPEIKLSAITNPNIIFAEEHIDHFERVNEISKQNIVKTGLTHVGYLFYRRFVIDNSPFEALWQGRKVVKIGAET